MDTLQFDHFASYSDSSTSRTPSPLTEIHPYTTNSPHYKPNLDIEPLRNMFSDHGHDDGGIVPEVHAVDVPFWPALHHSNNSNSSINHPVLNNNNTPSPFSFHSSSRGSLLQELYDDHSLTSDSHHQVYLDQSAEPPFNGSNNDWPNHTQLTHPHHSQSQHQSSRPTDFAALRRATFPYVRHDREDGISALQQQHQQHQHGQFQPTFITSDQQPVLGNPYASRTDTIYGEPLSLQDRRQQSLNIKLEDPAPVIVPSQTAFYRPPSQSSCHPMAMSYLSPHTGLPVQHTDDAASKETQYLRRRCFNCHTTEPPSWRRSTLNPGKIVCNKCGLYERTHLRPRPLRFDELRAGNKARKQSSKGAPGAVSPKAKTSALVKKEPRELGGLVRRSSMSSASSVSGNSDWDDNASVYSSGSAPGSAFNSPAISTYPIPRDSSSQSPPRDGGIRLPTNPLSDLASLQQPCNNATSVPLPVSVPSSPRKASTDIAPSSYYPTPPSSASPIPSGSPLMNSASTGTPGGHYATAGWQGLGGDAMIRPAAVTAS